MISDEQIYEDRAIVFMDILGFKKHIEDKNEKILLDALHIPHDIPKAFGGDSQKYGLQVSAFSDSIVLSTKVTQDPGGIAALITFAAYFQLKFIALGILVRGGATIGALHHKDGKLFGPAMNEAYELENSLAIYPRIAVSSQLRSRYLADISQMLTTENIGEDIDESIDLDDLIIKITRDNFFLAEDGVSYINCLSLYLVKPPEYQVDNDWLLKKASAERSLMLDLVKLHQDKVFEVAARPISKPWPKDPRANAKVCWYSVYIDKAKERYLTV